MLVDERSVLFMTHIRQMCYVPVNNVSQRSSHDVPASPALGLTASVERNAQHTSFEPTCMSLAFLPDSRYLCLGQQLPSVWNAVRSARVPHDLC